MRHDPHGCPLSPAVMAKERGNVTPLAGFGRRQGERFRLHTAGFTQSNNEIPPFVGHGSLSLFVVVAAVREDDHVTRIIGPARVSQVQLAEGIDHEVMLRVIHQIMLPAIALALERDGTKRNQHVMDDSHDIGPRMADDKAVAMNEPLGVFRMQTGPVLERTLDYECYVPGQTLALLPGFGNMRGLLLGETLQRRDRDVGLVLQHLREWGCVKSRKPGGVFEGLFRRHDHHKEEGTRADDLKTETDQAMTGDPSLPGAS
jgi:hypothetical protein